MSDCSDSGPHSREIGALRPAASPPWKPWAGAGSTHSRRRPCAHGSLAAMRPRAAPAVPSRCGTPHERRTAAQIGMSARRGCRVYCSSHNRPPRHRVAGDRRRVPTTTASRHVHRTFVLAALRALRRAGRRLLRALQCRRPVHATVAAGGRPGWGERSGARHGDVGSGWRRSADAASGGRWQFPDCRQRPGQSYCRIRSGDGRLVGARERHEWRRPRSSRTAERRSRGGRFVHDGRRRCCESRRSVEW